MMKFVALFLLAVCSPFQGAAFSYEHISDGPFISIHVLIVNPSEHTILPVKALGRETALELAKQHGAQAAVNGGFWKPDGTPAGALKIDHEWLGFPTKPRGAIGWSAAHQPFIDQILTEGTEVTPTSGYTSFEQWQDLKHIVGGTPVLVRDGHLIEDFSSEQTRESFLVRKHPRTAVGIREDGDWVFVVVDGRFHGLFGGMTMQELAAWMLDLECVEALNLDGGGSSTMVIEGHVVNTPCGQEEEEGKWVTAVSDAILIF
jgi:exopolysaccharide biosynthesis protein